MKLARVKDALMAGAIAALLALPLAGVKTSEGHAGEPCEFYEFMSEGGLIRTCVGDLTCDGVYGEQSRCLHLASTLGAPCGDGLNGCAAPLRCDAASRTCAP